MGENGHGWASELCRDEANPVDAEWKHGDGPRVAPNGEGSSSSANFKTMAVAGVVEAAIGFEFLGKTKEMERRCLCSS